ncbi:MAG: hypothetical protein A2Z91_01345 [Deltaproteobacteria bacterium GWA2_38_16]|nr:MAG: hypothetical protein A2Z91_01345 [Deltaproteobacteria bacterium GWA2_38_16]OGQ02190.1 MAG: hypothetical protein A3D19_05420 [Deltaproteobacteria bacterium RIFCSPHIGHO2_02_FULL_38_15]
MRGRNFGIGLLLFFFPMVVCSQDLIHSFLPIVKGHYFYLIETHGSHKITIDRWGTAPTSTLESLLKDVRQGRLSNPQRFFLTRNTNGFYELDSHSKTPDTLSPTFGFTEYNGSLFIAHREGIDEIDLSSLLEADESKVIDIKSFKPLPFATGIVFLKSVFKNDLMITSQWDPSQDSSTLSIFLDDDTKINEWQLNFPLLNLSLEALTLFAAGGKEGLHIFNIDPLESSIHPDFIKRTETVAPETVEASTLTGIWVHKNSIHFSATHNNFSSTLHEINLNLMIQTAHTLHQEKMNDVMSTSFQMKHNAKAFANGLLASIPFDADKLVDAFGFDLDQDLDEQLELYNVKDTLTEEEKAELKHSFSTWKVTGEIAGFATQLGLFAGKMAQIRYAKKARITQNVREMNAIRYNFKLAGGTASTAFPLAEGATWLRQWNEKELLIENTASFSQRLLELKALKASGQVLLPQELIGLIAATEKRGTFVRPLERVLVSLKLADTRLQKLEAWSFGKLSKFFKIMGETGDLSKLVDPEIMTKWSRLQRLQSMEQLSLFQKTELQYLTMDIKAGLLKGIARSQSIDVNQLGLSTKTKEALTWLSSKGGIVSREELEALSLESSRLSQILGNSEEVYRLERILELNQAGRQLTDLEKLEKLKLLVKSGWQGNQEAHLLWEKPQLLNAIDGIYDFEHMQRSTYMNRLFQNGKLKETLLFTAYSDIANLATEAWSREREGRPFLSTGLAHNIIWNTYIMFPIFGISGFRLSRNGKIFVLVLNAGSSAYMAQKLSKWGAETMNTQSLMSEWHNGRLTMNDFIPAPTMPLSEIPGYLTRDIFSPDPTYNAGWALFDTSWCMFLSTPRGIGVGMLSQYLTSRPALDREVMVLGVDAFEGLRQSVRMAPVFANETLGAVTYPPIYSQFFEDRSLELSILDAKLETVDSWQSNSWDQKPKLKLSLAIHSSTAPKDVHFYFSDGKKESFIELPASLWKEIYEQYYDLSWEQEITYEGTPEMYRISHLEISNSDRTVGSSLNPFSEKSLEHGKTLLLEDELTALVQEEDPFFQGVLKALLFLSQEAGTQFHQGKRHFAAGIVYMIGQYLEPLYTDFVSPQESHSLDIDAFKEAIKITHSVNFSDIPITKEFIDHLSMYLERLAYEAIPNNTLSIHSTLSHTQERQWLNQNTTKILSLISDDILKETKSSWLILDEGSKNDWSTLQLYKGYTFGLSKLYRWYGFHFNNKMPSHFFNLLDEMRDFGQELTESWSSSLYWSDHYLVRFAQNFTQLNTLLLEESQK